MTADLSSTNDPRIADELSVADDTPPPAHVNVDEEAPLPFLDNPYSPGCAQNSTQCVPEADSGYYGSSDASQSTRTVDSVRAGDMRSKSATGHSNAQTPPEATPPDPCPCRPPKPFPLAYQKDIYLIDQNPTLQVRQRWLNIEGPLSRALNVSLEGSGGPVKRVAMRLVMLGKADCQPTDARPSIVVFCLKEQRNRVKKFFERRDARDLYRPRGGDPDLPIFDFHIGPPPRLRGWDKGVEVLLTDSNIHQVLCPTLCGTPIHLKQSEMGLVRTATLGGIVTVADATNQVVCYGITAGHVIPAAHDAMEHLSGAAPISWNTGEGQIIGTVVDECLEQRESEDGRYYDWALCRLSPNFLAPNCLRPQGDNPTQHGKEHSAGWWAKLHTVDSAFRDAVDDIGVIVMTGSSGPKKGRLSTLPCPVMLGPGTEFITAFTVSFSEMEVIRDGDSGSWVVNESTLEVIGHVVATDEFDDAYIIPLTDVFEDIKRRFDAKSVELASPSSIRSVGVPAALNMRGIPELDAIRGNGVNRDDFPVQHDLTILQNGTLQRLAPSEMDSGYGSIVYPEGIPFPTNIEQFLGGRYEGQISTLESIDECTKDACGGW